MRGKRVLIPLYQDEVAPRFDLAGEVMIADVAFSEMGEKTDGHAGVVTGNVLLQKPSVDCLCELALSRDVDVVICGGIEEQSYHYLRWKRVEVLDNVAGRAQNALDRFARGELKAGDILFHSEGADVR